MRIRLLPTLAFAACLSMPGFVQAQTTPPVASTTLPSVSAPAASAPTAPAIATPAAAPAAALTLPRDLSPWGMFVAADIVVKAVMLGLAFASVLSWT
ncbi:MAG: tonB-system energizer ExbB, partial [Hyphomicrobiales bacterium]|nr:tonB-system energizer ExbB [Hyphomicrobiales bacterium]